MGKGPPPLATLAAIFALIDLAFVRILLRGSQDGELWNLLGAYAQVPLAIAAIAGSISLTASLVAILRMPPPPDFAHRLSLALFTGIFVPVVAAATFMPRTVIVRDSNFLVHLATFSGGALVVFFAAVAIPRPGPSAFRVGAFLLAMTSLASIFHLSATSLGVLGQMPLVAQVGALAEVLGLACYCLIPIAVGFKALTSALRGGHFLALGVGLLIGGIITAALMWLSHMDLRVERSITAGLGFHHLSTLWRQLPAFAVGVFATVCAWFALTRQVQVSLSILLLLCAGFSPTAPGYLVMWVLGTALLMRASMSVQYAPLHGRQAPQSRELDHDANHASGHASGEHAAEHGAQA